MDSDSSSDPIEKQCHLQETLWKKLEKKWLKQEVLWSYFMECDEKYPKVPKEELTDLVLYTRCLRHILSCDICDDICTKKSLTTPMTPMKLTRHRSETKN